MRLLILIYLLAGALMIPSISVAFEPLAATVSFKGGGVYDYVVLGESPQATDGYDNTFDTVTAGGSMNRVYISAWFDHPDWGTVKRQFSADIRSTGAQKIWTITMVHTLPAGTPVTVSVDPALSALPASAGLSLVDTATGTVTDLAAGSYTFAAAAGVREFTVTVSQQDTVPSPVIPPPAPAADGDVDGSGSTTITDAVTLLRMILGLDSVSPGASIHGDMDGDGRLTVRDALKVLRKAVGLQ